MFFSGKSEICKRSYHIEDVEILFNNLSAQLSNHLLFLRSVTSIELYRCTAGDRTPILIRKAAASLMNRETINDQSLMKFFDKKNDRAKPSAAIPIVSALPVGATRQQQATKTVLASSGSALQSQNVAASKDAFYDILASTKDENMPTSCVGIVIDVFEKEILTERVEYIVCSGIRGGSAKAIACDPSRRHLKLVPVSLCMLFNWQ